MKPIAINLAETISTKIDSYPNGRAWTVLSVATRVSGFIATSLLATVETIIALVLFQFKHAFDTIEAPLILLRSTRILPPPAPVIRQPAIPEKKSNRPLESTLERQLSLYQQHLQSMATIAASCIAESEELKKIIPKDDVESYSATSEILMLAQYLELAQAIVCPHYFPKRIASTEITIDKRREQMLALQPKMLALSSREKSDLQKSLLGHNLATPQHLKNIRSEIGNLQQSLLQGRIVNNIDGAGQGTNIYTDMLDLI